MKRSSQLIEFFKCGYIVFSFFLPDALLRILTRWLGYYSIYELPPSIFTVCWAVLFLVVLSLFKRKAARIIYACLYGVWSLYSVVQYVYYLIFGKFLYISDFASTAEGADYADYILRVLNFKTFASIIVFIAVGIIGFLIFPNFKALAPQKLRIALRSALCVICAAAIALTPMLYEDNPKAPFFSSKYEYSQFTNSGFDMEIAGLYQYVARDLWCSYLKPAEDRSELKAVVKNYLSEKEKHETNAKTGILKGKNIILVQLESLDDWILSEETTPTILKMMNEGINFNGFHTPLFGSGSTFGTEFAVNTGVFQSVTGKPAYSRIKNSYPLSLASIFKNQGYSCNSFHENTGNFYNRYIIHPTLGYEKYIPTRDYLSADQNPLDDTTITSNEKCWQKITADEPFFSFIITYSAHLTYSYDDEVAKIALERYPEYRSMTSDEQFNALYSKARLTDDMLKIMLEKLERDGLLDNTAIIAYTDHYCYGLDDKPKVRELSEKAGSRLLEKTPAFIWYSGCESERVDKICQTVDLLPTIANLWGVDISGEVLGNDIFDPSYEGIAIFPDGTWLTSGGYAENGVINGETTLSSDEISLINNRVQEFYRANDAILEADYYSDYK